MKQHKAILPAISLRPAARVFIFGSEIKDVLSVTTSNSLAQEPGSCTIDILNPEGKWIITRRNLQKKWELTKDKTKQIFETKWESGIRVHEGDPVFQDMDPVRVFFKGRYQNKWYFGFTGYVSDVTESYTTNSDRIVTIKCEDILKILRFSKTNINPALVKDFNLELRKIIPKKGTSLKKFTGKVFSALMKEALLGASYKADTIYSAENAIERAAYFRFVNLQKERIDPKLITQDMMNSKRYWEYNINTKSTELSEAFMNAANSITNWRSLDFDDDLDLALSTTEDIFNRTARKSKKNVLGFLRLRSTMIEESVDYLNQKSLHEAARIIKDFINLLNTSLLKDPDALIPRLNAITNYTDLSSDESLPTNIIRIGGEETFLTGYHPGITNSQVSRFEILIGERGFGVYNNIKETTKSNKNLLRSPYEKIREDIEGNPYTANYESYAKGVAYNPRFFLVSPNVLDTEKSIFAAQFRTFPTVQANDFDSILTIIYKLAKVVDFQFYATPMGDVVCEPFYYDNYPWNFDLDDKGEEKGSDYYIKSRPLRNKNSIFKMKDNPSESATAPIYYINNKDVINISNDELDSKLKTSIHVTARAYDNYVNVPDFKGYLAKVAQEGYYIADGFQSLYEKSPQNIERDDVLRLSQTVQGLNKLEEKGMYDFDQDLISRYGARPVLDVNSRLVRGGDGAQEYAKILFLRFLSMVYPINVNMIYHPESFLNRPHYIQDKNRIGIPYNINHSYQQDSGFTSSITFEYMRKNNLYEKYSGSFSDYSWFPIIGLVDYDKLNIDVKKTIDIAEEKQTNYQITEKIMSDTGMGPPVSQVHTIKKSNGLYAIFWTADRAMNLIDLPRRFPVGSLLGNSGTSFLREIVNFNYTEVEEHARTLGIADTTIDALSKSLAKYTILAGSTWTIPIVESYVNKL